MTTTTTAEIFCVWYISEYSWPMQEKSHVCEYDCLTMVALFNEKLLCTVGHLPQKHKRYFWVWRRESITFWAAKNSLECTLERCSLDKLYFCITVQDNWVCTLVAFHHKNFHHRNITWVTHIGVPMVPFAWLVVSAGPFRLTLAMRFSELLTENWWWLWTLCSSRLCKLPWRRRLLRSFMLDERARFKIPGGRDGGRVPW